MKRPRLHAPSRVVERDACVHAVAGRDREARLMGDAIVLLQAGMAGGEQVTGSVALKQ